MDVPRNKPIKYSQLRNTFYFLLPDTYARLLFPLWLYFFKSARMLGTDLVLNRTSMKYKAVFLENNGTITSEIANTIHAPAIEFNEDVVEGLQRLQSYGYL